MYGRVSIRLICQVGTLGDGFVVETERAKTKVNYRQGVRDSKCWRKG